MKLQKLSALLLMLASSAAIASATNVTVTMNGQQPAMSLVSKADGKEINVGEKDLDNVYNFEAPDGVYTLTAYAKDDKSIEAGTIEIEVSPQNNNFKVLSVRIKCLDKNSEGQYLTLENGGYTIRHEIRSREGKLIPTTLGKAASNRTYIIPALDGNSYFVDCTPCKELLANGRGNFTTSGTLADYGAILSFKFPIVTTFSVTVPEDASFILATKKNHYSDFIPVAPKETRTADGNKEISYSLPTGAVYNWRTWKEGQMTYAGYFTASDDNSKNPVLTYTDDDYLAHDPATINHDVNSNEGYETGSILLNINERGHKEMAVGETFKLLAMRSWQLTDGITNNYYIEPTFHYQVLDTDGKPSTGVVEIDSKPESAWADLKAVGKGTAIVLVTYDAIDLNMYNPQGVKYPFEGGSFWCAIWPENTGVFVVTVGGGYCAVKPEMTLNAKLNEEKGSSKIAGKYIDAEHDVLYYLEGEDGYKYTFTPENASNVTVAYPTITDTALSYSGFSSDGVTKNDDGSYTVLVKSNRQIVRLTDAGGNSTYQILNGRPFTYEISNVSRPESSTIQPGDEIKIQFKGLSHPANKLAGIYNASASPGYHVLPEYCSLNTTGGSQYKFGSTPAAQSNNFIIGSDYDAEKNPEAVFSGGCILAGGYGDPIGNHRNTEYGIGRNPNFNAIQQGAYCGALPDMTIHISPMKLVDVNFECNVPDVIFEIKSDKYNIAPSTDTRYRLSFGKFKVYTKKAGYRGAYGEFEITEETEGPINILFDLKEAENAWDGLTVTEPQKNENDYYLITDPAELVWFANSVNSGNSAAKAMLMNDVDLGDYEWTPIGNGLNPFAGTFDGNYHNIKGLCTRTPANYTGLFGEISAPNDAPALVTRVNVYGTIAGRYTNGGIAGFMRKNATIDRCVNYATITGFEIAGIAGSMNETCVVSNCINAGEISGTTDVAGIVNPIYNSDFVYNCLNIGTVKSEDPEKVHPCVGSSYSVLKNFKNCFSVQDAESKTGFELVTAEQMKSGEIACKLGKAFGQKIGVDSMPYINGPRVGYDEVTGTYINLVQTEFDIKIDCNAPNPSLEVIYEGKQLSPGENGLYFGESGEYSVTARCADYLLYRNTFVIKDTTTGLQTFTVVMEESKGCWDGESKTEPATDENGFYLITTPTEFAWFADNVNNKGQNQNAILKNDISLGTYPWKPISLFKGEFIGGNHTISDLCVENENYAGLFDRISGSKDKYASVSGLIVKGSVSGLKYVGGLVARVSNYVNIDRCANYATISYTGTDDFTYAGGLIGYMSCGNGKLSNCYNAGTVTSQKDHAGIIGCAARVDQIENIFNIGDIEENDKAYTCFGNIDANYPDIVIPNVFAVKEYVPSHTHVIVTPEQMASGEIAYKLGDAFGQKIGVDPYPVFNGPKVLYNEADDIYYNEGSESGIGSVVTENDAEIEGYYNLQGVRSDRPWQGFNIVRRSDGSIRKILVK